MSTAPTEPRPPKCPHCKKDMPMVALYPYQIGKLLLPAVQCPWCAVMLYMAIITPAVSEVPEENPPIWRPPS